MRFDQSEPKFDLCKHTGFITVTLVEFSFSSRVKLALVKAILDIAKFKLAKFKNKLQKAQAYLLLINCLSKQTSILIKGKQ